MVNVTTGWWRCVGIVVATTAVAAACDWLDPRSEAPGGESTPFQTPFAAVPVPELFLDPEAKPDEGPAPLTVRFDPNVEDNLGPVVECEWDFGDGSPKVKDIKPTHVFQKANDYEIQVSCRDAEGLVGEAEVDVFVE